MGELRLYAKWVFCIREKCAYFHDECSGTDDKCKNPMLFPANGITDDNMAAFERTDSPPSEIQF